MNIDGPSQKKLREALLSAFPTRLDLEMMVHDELNENLFAITGESNLERTVFELIRWAIARGSLEELVLAALQYNRQNPQLASVARQLGLSEEKASSSVSAQANSPSFGNTSSAVTSAKVTKPFEVFISYAHQDRKYRDELAKHLSNLRNQKMITDWFDEDIISGTEWRTQILQHLNSAEIILLLISADFMASEFCYSVELVRAIERHHANEALVIPIILRPTDWEGAPFADLLVLPDDAKPINRWSSSDDAYDNVVRGIRKAIKVLQIMTSSSAHDFGSELRKLRQGLAQTQSELANSLGVAERTLQSWELGGSLPSLTLLKKLIEIFLRGGSFSKGREQEEAELLWAQAAGEPFDQVWFRELFRMHVSSSSGLTKGSPSERRKITGVEYQLHEVFKKSGVPTVTFVEREDFELLKLSLAQLGRGVVIEGPSGSGKTTIVEKAVEVLSSRQHGPNIEILSARKPEHRTKLQTLRQWHLGTVIIDDFHRLDSQLQVEMIDYLKYLADTEPLSKKLVIVGIPQTGQTLVDVSFDIATRIDVFKIGSVSDELLLRMIEKGEEALNIRLDRTAEIALAASGSFNIAQFLCFYICYHERCLKTKGQLEVVACNMDGAVDDVMTHLSMKFKESIRRFAAIGGSRDFTTLMFLQELANSEDGFLSLSMLKDLKPSLALNIERFLNEAWMDKLYKQYPDSASHLFFDKTVQALVIDDPQLAFYLKKMRIPTFSRNAGKSATSARQKVFVSYSHKDVKWLKRLQVHLSSLEREGLIDLWDDTTIVAGMQWKDAIFEALETAKVAVVLVSADFLASSFIAEHELPELLSRAASSGTVILPVIISPCSFGQSKLSTFQTVNPPNKPLSAMISSERERVWVNLAEAIRKQLAHIKR